MDIRILFAFPIKLNLKVILSFNLKYVKVSALLLDELEYNWKENLFEDNRSLYEILNSVVGRNDLPYKLLIADDEVEIIEILELYLEKDGFELVKAKDGLEAWELLQNIDGFNLTKKIREHYNIPILILSVKNQDNDKILGLGLGADDYITKPFNPLEVSARVQAQRRRFYNLNINTPNEKRNNYRKDILRYI